MKESPALTITGSLQLALYGLIALFGLFAYLAIGHWPSYGNPDPKTLWLGFLVPIIYPFMFAAALSVVVYPLFAFITNGLSVFRKSHFWMYIAGLALWLTDFAYIHLVNPQQDGLLDWLLD